MSPKLYIYCFAFLMTGWSLSGQAVTWVSQMPETLVVSESFIITRVCCDIDFRTFLATSTRKSKLYKNRVQPKQLKRRNLKGYLRLQRHSIKRI